MTTNPTPLNPDALMARVLYRPTKELTNGR